MSSTAVRSFATSAHKLLVDFPFSANLSGWNVQVEKAKRYQAAYLLIELNDLWADFCRTLILQNAMGRATDLGGNPIVPVRNFATEEDVLNAVRDKRGYEPRWHNATKATRAEGNCATNKSRQIRDALTSSQSPAPIVNSVRNYLAHRRSDCREILSSQNAYVSATNFDPFKIGNFPKRDGRRTIEFWVDEMITIAIACST